MESSGEAMQGRIHDFVKGGGGGANSCRRQRIEVRRADQSAQSAEIFFRLHFSVVRMGSRGTFVLSTASSRVATRVSGSMLHRDVKTKLFK